jgi:hypothetical protein
MSIPACYQDDAEAKKLGKSLFNALDTDGTGSLSQVELRRARTIMLCKSDNVDLCQMAAGVGTAADLNNDGKVDDQEWHEFVAAVYSVAGRKTFLALARSWVSNSGNNTSKMPQPKKKAAGPAKKREDSQALDMWAELQTAVGEDCECGHELPAEAVFCPSCGEKKPEKKPAPTPKAGSKGEPLSSPAGRKAPKDGVKEQPKVKVAKTWQAGCKDEDQAALDRAEAALKIQSIARGRADRKAALAKAEEVSPVAARSRASVAGGSRVGEPEAEKASTAADVWDLIVISTGSVSTSVEAEDIAEIFRTCRLEGITADLGKTMPMTTTFVDDQEPEDVSPGEIAHLCALLKKDPELKLADARTALNEVKEHYREMAAGPYIMGDGSEFTIGLKRFKNLVYIVSELMRIDQVFILAIMTFLKSGVFEMPDTLVALIREQGSREDIRSTDQKNDDLAKIEDPWSRSTFASPDRRILQTEYTQDDFMKLAHKSHIIDSGPNGPNGILYADVQLIFRRTHQKMAQLLEARASKIRRRPRDGALAVRAEEPKLYGKAEFAVLMEELLKSGTMRHRFKGSPMNMCLKMMQTAAEHQMVDQAAIDAACSVPIASAEKKGKWKG